MFPHDQHDLGNNLAHSLGLLDDDPEATVAAEQALRDCERCRAENSELMEFAEQVRTVPREMSLDGDPDLDRPGDQPLQQALSRIQAASLAPDEPPVALLARRRPPGRWIIAAAAAAAVVLVLAGGVGVGLVIASTPVVVAQPQDRTDPPPTNAETVVAQGRRGAVEMTARLTPAQGWVRVNVTTSGIEPGRLCEIVVQDTDGGQRVAGSWEVAAPGVQPAPVIDGSAGVDPAEVSAVLVRDANTRETLVSAEA